jgi:catechol 2,3-dioxygenase-like lactoylglutathione lyase family enzyme
MSDFPHPGHVVVTVTDFDASRTWYRALFDREPVLDEDTGTFRHVVWAWPNGFLFGIHGFPDGRGDRFDERRTGLDHVSFHVADRAELERWASRLDEKGIEHGPIVDAPYGSGVAFRDPDNVQLEFFTFPA